MTCSVKFVESDIRKLLIEKNKSALVYLYDSYAPALYGLILKLVKEQADAENVLRNTFVTVWQQANTKKNLPVNLFVWLHNIARDVALQTLNKQISESRAQLQQGLLKDKMPLTSSL